MDIGATFVSYAESTKLMEPRQGSLNDPAVYAQLAPVLDAAAGQDRLDVQPHERIAVSLGIIGAIALNAVGTAAGPAGLAGDRGNGVNQRQQLRHVVAVRARELGGQRDAVGIGDDVMLRPVFPPIRGVRAGLLPPKTARTEALSTTPRDQSSWFSARNSLSSTWWRSCQTPASCQSRSRRQHVMPHPQPISCGRSSQGMPVFNTNMMPVNALRSSMGVRPPLGRGLCGGRQGSMRAQSSSVSSGLAIGSSSMTTNVSKSLLFHRSTYFTTVRFC